MKGLHPIINLTNADDFDWMMRFMVARQQVHYHLWCPFSATQSRTFPFQVGRTWSSRIIWRMISDHSNTGSTLEAQWKGISLSCNSYKSDEVAIAVQTPVFCIISFPPWDAMVSMTTNGSPPPWPHHNLGPLSCSSSGSCHGGQTLTWNLVEWPCSVYRGVEGEVVGVWEGKFVMIVY